MADFEIKLDTLQAKKNTLSSSKTKVEKIVESYNSSTIKKASSAINKVSAKITKNMGRLSTGYTNSVSWLTDYLSELNSLEASLASFSVDTMTQIKKFKGSFEDIFGKVTMPAIKTGGDPNCNEKLGTLVSGNVIKITLNGKEYFVVDTKMSVEEYANYIKSNRMTQNDGLLGGQCMILSQYYAADLIRGTKTSKSTMASLSGGPAVRINNKCRSQNESDVLRFAYNEINAGRPVVLQVTQIHSDKGLRHLVTMVGYTPDVKSAADLTPDKILVLDCVDGKLQTLGQARSEGGHERRLFNQGGKGYYALGATDKFLASLNTGTQTA